MSELDHHSEKPSKTRQREAAERAVAALSSKVDQHLAPGGKLGPVGQMALALGVYLPLVMKREPTLEDRDALAGIAARLGMYFIALAEGPESVAAYEKWAQANFESLQGDGSL